LDLPSSPAPWTLLSLGRPQQDCRRKWEASEALGLNLFAVASGECVLGGGVRIWRVRILERSLLSHLSSVAAFLTIVKVPGHMHIPMKGAVPSLA
jgi:hypothetical protein